MSVSKLVTLVPPPSHPVESGSDADWKAIEAVFRTELPCDYRDMCKVYGTGRFRLGTAVSIELYNLFDKQLLKRALAFRENLTMGAQEEAPELLAASDSSILPITHDIRGQYIAYVCNGPPSSWPLITFWRGFERYTIFNLKVSEFLTEVFSCRLDPVIYTAEDLSNRATFVPLLPRRNTT